MKLKTLQTVEIKKRFLKEHPVLCGHFPGNPIVPAALLLDTVVGECRNRTGTQVIGVSKFRFNRILTPDTPFSINFRMNGEGEVRVQCTTAEHELCRGRMMTSGCEPVSLTARQPGPGQLICAAEAYQILPHAGAMQLIDRFEYLDEKRARSRLTLRETNPFAQDGLISTWSVLEHAAQLLACHTIKKSQSKCQDQQLRMKKVWIIGVRHMTCAKQDFLKFGQAVDLDIEVITTLPQTLNCNFLVRDANKKSHCWGNFSVHYE